MNHGTGTEEELDALVARLEVEVRRINPSGWRSSGDSSRALRHLEQMSFIAGGAPAGGSGPRGRLSRLVKRVMLKLTRWYVQPLIEQQRQFNLAVVEYLQHSADVPKRSDVSGENS